MRIALIMANKTRVCQCKGRVLAKGDSGIPCNKETVLVLQRKKETAVECKQNIPLRMRGQRVTLTVPRH